jgi:ADP-heptose:LPS heptosyltransferase
LAAQRRQAWVPTVGAGKNLSGFQADGLYKLSGLMRYGPLSPFFQDDLMAPFPFFAANDIGVIVGRDLVGDALIKLPFLRALRAAWPKAEIHWITAQGPTAYGGPLRDATRHLIDVIHETPDWLETEAGCRRPEVRDFTGLRFDLLLDTRNRWREARLARRGVPHRLFIAPAMRFLFSDRRPSPLAPRPPHLVDRLLKLVELAAGAAPEATGRLPVPENMLAKARRLLPPGPVYVGFAPGAGNPVKAWPRCRFEKVAALQAGRGRVPVFLLGPQELDWYAALMAAVPTALFPLQAAAVWETPVLSVEQTLAIGSLLDGAVANDSGTGHMLAAVDCPLVSLFGPTSPARLAPKVSRGLVIRAQDFDGSPSMNAIRGEAVDAAIENFILRGKTQ